MANNTDNDNTDNDSTDLWTVAATWSTCLLPALFIFYLAQNFITFLLVALALGVTVSAVYREMRAQEKMKKEQEERKEIQKLLSSPDPPSKLTADPALYKRAQAELQARKEDALKMQQLHVLRQQVEEEERKAGIFAPTLSPTKPESGSNSPQNDPSAAAMAQLTRRRIEAERQKHLMKSLRTVEDAEWEADDV